MNLLFEKVDQRSFEILNYLFLTYGTGIHIVSFDELAKIFSIENRTVFKILSSINKDIDDLQLASGLYFSFTRSSLTFEITSKTTSAPFSALYLKRSLIGIFLNEVFYHQFTTVDNFLEDHFISKTTFSRRLAILKSILIPYNLEINLLESDILTGKEHMIRYFFFVFYYTRNQLDYSFNTLFLSPELENHLVTLFSQFQHFNVPLFLKIRVYLIIMIERINTGHYLEEPIESFSLDNYMWGKDDLTAYFSGLLATLKVPPAYISIETRFILYALAVLNPLSLDKFDRIEIKKINLYNQQDAHTERWIDLFCSSFNLMLKSNEYLFLVTNLTYIHGRKKLFGNALNFNDLSAPQKESYEPIHPYTKERSHLFFKELEKHGFVLDNHLRYNYFLLLRSLTNLIYPNIQVYLLSKRDEKQYSYLKAFILQTHHYVTIVENPSAYVDLVVSDFLVNDFPFWSPHTPTFYWNSFPTHSQWLGLFETLESLYYSQTEKHSE